MKDKRTLFPVIVIIALLVAMLACSRPGSSEVVEVTETPRGHVLVDTPLPSQPTHTPIQPTPNPTRFPMTLNDGSYTVQPGDTLASIAARFAVPLESILSINAIANANLLEVGQILQIPSDRPNPSGSFKIIPDSELVFGPTTVGFDVTAYVKLKPGFLRAYSEDVDGELYTGPAIIEQVALDYSVNPRLLLALLEYKGGWLSNPTPSEEAIQYPMGYYDPNRSGLARQLLFAANALNTGYYGWRHRGLESASFADGTPLVFAPDLNAGTVAVEFFLAQGSTQLQWQFDASEQGFFQTYLSLFGDPFRAAVEPLVPPDLKQPAFNFPFSSGETWFFTGGPHGGYNSGSAWSAIDFAPPAPPDQLILEQGYCYISPGWVTAVAPGVIARSGNGYVILDLDFDGNEHTGWIAMYLHISSSEIIAAGTRVEAGDRLGHPSCEGGFSTATHLHFARRYNGEWIPADCQNCPPGVAAPRLKMSGWTMHLSDQSEYQGYMTHDTIQGERWAEQGREDPINHVSY